MLLSLLKSSYRPRLTQEVFLDDDVVDDVSTFRWIVGDMTIGLDFDFLLAGLRAHSGCATVLDSQGHIDDGSCSTYVLRWRM